MWRPGLIERSFFNGRTLREEAQLTQARDGCLTVRDLVQHPESQYQNHAQGYANAVAHYERIIADRISVG